MPAINEILHQERYRIIREFGQDDSTGAVYEAYDNVLKTNVLLRENLVKLKKVATAAQRETLRLAFVSEAQALTQINHEAFLRVLDYFSEIDRQYLVFESVGGEDFARLIEKNKRPFTLSEVGGWTDQLLDALSFLHARRPPIIYRSLKPQNARLGANGRIKLFPSVKISANGESKAAANSSDLPFLPLEQIWGGLDPASQKVILNSYDEKSARMLEMPPDARSDIYSLGATAYYLLTARPPADPLTRSIDILEGKHDPLLPPSRLNPSVSSEISEILMKALEIKRENRFESAAAMRQAWRAEFARIKERRAAAEKAKQEAAATAVGAFNVRPTEKTGAASEREIIETKKHPKIESESAAPQMREAEAETRPVENAVENSNNNGFSTDEIAKPTADFIETAPAEKTISAAASSAHEFGALFAEPPKDNKTFLRMSAVALVLVIFAGAGLGGWFLLKPNSAESSRPLADPAMTLSNETQPAQQIEAQPASVPVVETKSEADTPADSPSDISAETPDATTAVKNKNLPPRVKKQTPPAQPAPAKTPAAQKKPITVEDLINDN